MSAQPEQFHFPWGEPVPAIAGARLTGQHKLVFDYMADGEWRTLAEIAKATGITLASVSTPLRNLRKEEFGAHTVDKRRRAAAPVDAGAPPVWEYSLRK
jgi:predicted transcriptional regulator